MQPAVMKIAGTAAKVPRRWRLVQFRDGTSGTQLQVSSRNDDRHGPSGNSVPLQERFQHGNILPHGRLKLVLPFVGRERRF